MFVALSSLITFIVVSRNSISIAAIYVAFSTMVIFLLTINNTATFVYTVLLILNISVTVTVYSFRIVEITQMQDLAQGLMIIKLYNVLLLLAYMPFLSTTLLLVGLINLTPVILNLSSVRLQLAFASSTSLLLTLNVDLATVTHVYLILYFAVTILFLTSTLSFTMRMVYLMVLLGFPLNFVASMKFVILSTSPMSAIACFLVIALGIIAFMSGIGEAISDSVTGPSGSLALTRTSN